MLKGRRLKVVSWVYLMLGAQYDPGPYLGVTTTVEGRTYKVRMLFIIIVRVTIGR